jgi:hypothetical protein
MGRQGEWAGRERVKFLVEMPGGIIYLELLQPK